MRTLQQNEVAFISGGCDTCGKKNSNHSLTFSLAGAYLSGGLVLGALGNIEKLNAANIGLIVSGIAVLLIGGQVLDQHVNQTDTTVAA